MPIFRPKPFYIAVNPINSRFAKELQRALRPRIKNKVYRVGYNSSRFDSADFYIPNHGFNKLRQFQLFKEFGINCPEFVDGEHLLADIRGNIIVARKLLSATQGRGIVIFNKSDPDIPAAPLYTQYIKKKAEYRFHVLFDEVIDVQQKKKRREFDAANRNTRIRNLANGYVYTRDGISYGDEAAHLAMDAVRALGYAYGAVDIIYNEKQNQYFVLEVNSRPGLMGTTMVRYCDKLITYFNLTWK